MTGTAPSHLDLDALADVLAGEADEAALAHLATCGSCTSRLGELEAAEQRVVSVLATLPPPPVPDDLAERLSAAFAAEPPLTSGRANVTALPVRSPRRTWLPAAAAAVLLASGAGLGWALLQGGGDAADDASTAGNEVVVASSGTDYADAAAVAAALPGVLGTGEVTTYGGGAAARSEDATAESGDAVPDEGDAAGTAEAPAAATMSVDALERLRTPAGLAACLVGLQSSPQEPPVEPLAVDFATYDGAPALAVVLLDPDPSKLSVFVVGPDCAQDDAHLLHFVRVDAP